MTKSRIGSNNSGTDELRWLELSYVLAVARVGEEFYLATRLGRNRANVSPETDRPKMRGLQLPLLAIYTPLDFAAIGTKTLHVLHGPWP